jgi:hypothetical protein
MLNSRLAFVSLWISLAAIFVLINSIHTGKWWEKLAAIVLVVFSGYVAGRAQQWK